MHRRLSTITQYLSTVHVSSPARCNKATHPTPVQATFTDTRLGPHKSTRLRIALLVSDWQPETSTLVRFFPARKAGSDNPGGQWVMSTSLASRCPLLMANTLSVIFLQLDKFMCFNWGQHINNTCKVNMIMIRGASHSDIYYMYEKRHNDVSRSKNR